MPRSFFSRMVPVVALLAGFAAVRAATTIVTSPAKPPAATPAQTSAATSGLAATRTKANAKPAPAVQPAWIVDTGEIEGAKFMIARPLHWNKRLLLLAHGYRAEDRPLVADLFPEQLAYRTLLEEGWIVAKTSYRRNGIIVADAIMDLDFLRDHIAAQFGAPDRTIVEGESMGGLIGTLIAERESDLDEAGRYRFHGVIAIGAALSVQERGRGVSLSLVPRMPLLFVSNQSELEGPQGYVENPRARSLRPEERPALFRIARDGHVNVNQAERLAALRVINEWLDTGDRSALPSPANGQRFYDATVKPEPEPSHVAMHADARGFETHVTEVSAVYGNVALDAQAADFAAAGIEPKTLFLLRVGEQTWKVLYGHDFGDAPKGEWVAFPNADGFTWLARNYGDAAATAGLKSGSTASVSKLDDAP